MLPYGDISWAHWRRWQHLTCGKSRRSAVKFRAAMFLRSVHRVQNSSSCILHVRKCVWKWKKHRSVLSVWNTVSLADLSVKAKCIMTWVCSSTTSKIALNILDTFKKTYLTKNSSTETVAEYQWMHGAYIHITGSNAKTQCRTFHCRTTLHVLSNLKITIVPRIWECPMLSATYIKVLSGAPGPKLLHCTRRRKQIDAQVSANYQTELIKRLQNRQTKYCHVAMLPIKYWIINNFLL